ncbi:MAG TPA: hypothetical protein VMW23_03210 [Sedimentisphaerales bacterium]|nr:hypothetical protein [Sedimentisphaerales bacterium]
MPDRSGGEHELAVYADYTPVKVEIMPLTEFTGHGDTENAAQLRVYLGLLDAFGCQIKSPGKFRFELYERLLRSADPKGKRIKIWPDIDLTAPDMNNRYWRDFLRAYSFDLSFDPPKDRDYILQVTFLCPLGRRLPADFLLKYAK